MMLTMLYYSNVYLFVYLFICLFVCLFVRSCVHSLVRLCMRACVRSVRPSVPSFVHVEVGNLVTFSCSLQKIESVRIITLNISANTGIEIQFL